MSIRYSVVGRANQVLVSSGTGVGNVAQVVEDLLARINTDIDDRKSYTADNVTFHYIVSSKIVYLCVADEQYPVTQAYHYLQTLQNEWTRYYGARGLSVAPNTAAAEFGRKMASLSPASSFSQGSSSTFGRSSNPTGSQDKVEMVSRQIEDVKKQMVQNLDKVLERGEGIEKLVESTSSLNTNAAQFRTTAVKLKRHMCWKNAKCWIIMVVVLLVLAFVIALIACKANFKTCGHKKSSSPSPPHSAPHAAPHDAPHSAPVNPPVAIAPITLPPPIPEPTQSPPTQAPTPVMEPVTAPIPIVIAPVASPIPQPVAVPITPPTAAPIDMAPLPVVEEPISAPVSAPAAEIPVASPKSFNPISSPAPVAPTPTAPFANTPTPALTTTPVLEPVAPSSVPASSTPSSPVSSPSTAPVDAPSTLMPPVFLPPVKGTPAVIGFPAGVRKAARAA